MHSVGLGWVASCLPVGRVGSRFFGLGWVFWLWVGFFGLGWILGKKSWLVPGPRVLVGQKLWPIPTSRIGRVGSDQFFCRWVRSG
jgi:hypothetical protein